MKVLVLAAVLAASVSAQARSIEAQRTETLTIVNINGAKTDLTGVLTINYLEKTIKVDLFSDPCGQLRPAQPGTIRCMAAATLKHTLEVPLHKSANDGCGTIVSQGSENLMPADGPLTQITVKDHALRRCENVVPSILEVDASQTNAWNGKTTVYRLLK